MFGLGQNGIHGLRNRKIPLTVLLSRSYPDSGFNFDYFYNYSILSLASTSVFRSTSVRYAQILNIPVILLKEALFRQKLRPTRYYLVHFASHATAKVSKACSHCSLIEANPKYLILHIRIISLQCRGDHIWSSQLTSTCSQP